MFFQDDSSVWNETPIWVNWIYDEQLRLLMICPDMPPVARVLWHKVLKYVGAMDWLAYFEGNTSVLQAHRMIYHEPSILRLVQQLSPKHVWVMGEIREDALRTKVIQSAPPQEWIKSSIKRQLWSNWLNILKK
ncbi:MAG: hypothetical protein EBQ95_03670 [Gammaproteobacteria bacterium]|nr:hypothetical protein [Gammaproteobacteria bacterium]